MRVISNQHHLIIIIIIIIIIIKHTRATETRRAHTSMRYDGVTSGDIVINLKLKNVY